MSNVACIRCGQQGYLIETPPEAAPMLAPYELECLLTLVNRMVALGEYRDALHPDRSLSPLAIRGLKQIKTKLELQINALL